MAQRSALRSLWRATRNRLAELNRRLAEGGDPDAMVFQARPSNLTNRRIANGQSRPEAPEGAPTEPKPRVEILAGSLPGARASLVRANKRF